MSPSLKTLTLPAAVTPMGSAVLACGAWLKNSACLIEGNQVTLSAVHGDLGEAANCLALEASVAALMVQAKGKIKAVAHDLHPDFFSSRLAVQTANQLQVPAIAVQHHHAHAGVLMAEYGLDEAVIAVTLDGVGLGTDGVAWGGELLWVDGPHWQRLGHFSPLCLPGGDVAAREPWRMAAAVLHALGRRLEIVDRYGPVVGKSAASMVQIMLDRQLNSPITTSAGRWFDAAAGALGISVRQAFEAEAAIGLEQLATQYLATHSEPDQSCPTLLHTDGQLDLLPLLGQLFALADQGDAAVARGAALFHLTLVEALLQWTLRATRQYDIRTVALGGGCFFNRLVTERLVAGLQEAGLRVVLPKQVSCGDAGLALGQAWVAAQLSGLGMRQSFGQSVVQTMG